MTFTENAATTHEAAPARARSSGRARTPRSPPRSARAWRPALDVLERASVTTIHALCAPMLAGAAARVRRRAGLPRRRRGARPTRFFAEAWDEWLAERLSRATRCCSRRSTAASRSRASAGASAARCAGWPRTLVDQRDLRPLVAAEPPEPEDEARDELLEQAGWWRVPSRPVRAPATAWPSALLQLAPLAEAARGPRGRGPRAAPAARCRPSRRTSARRATGRRPERLAAGRAIAAWTKEERAALGRRTSSAAVHGRIVRSLADVVRPLRAAQGRARALLDFLDLLRRTRDALRDNPACAAGSRGRFPFVVIDEFQDTDPLQVEIAELARGRRPGALVVVGDAKQSIYRFRRAEVRLFRELVTRAEDRAAATRRLHLVQNFRSRPGDPALRQPRVRRADRALGGGGPAILRADRGRAATSADEPAVLALRFAAGIAERLWPGAARRPRRTALARFLAHVAAGGESVRDPASGGPARPAAPATCSSSRAA